MNYTPTPHNSAKEGDFAKSVLLAGDPLRVKMIAEKFLKNAKLVNNVRGIQGYTGTYNGKEVSVMASGMGCASMGIYSYELFKFYDVDNIIRVGTAGSFQPDVKIKDIVLAKESWSNTNYDNFYTKNNGEGFIECSSKLLKQAQKLGKQLKLCTHTGKIFCTDTFYGAPSFNKELEKRGFIAIEMESTALYINAKKCKKNALCICTISDSFVTGEKCSAEERQENFTKMIELALELC